MRLENLNLEQRELPFQGVGVLKAAETSANRLLEVVSTWRNRARQRAALARMNSALRRDIGVSEADLWKEIRKFPWEA